MGEPIEIKNDAFRMDFKIEVLNTSPDGLMELMLTPDPDRYEWLEDDDGDGRILYDRNTKTRIPESVLAEAAEQAAGVPIYAPPMDIPEAPKLLEERREAIEAALREDGQQEELASPAAEALAEKAGKPQEFAVLSIDIVRRLHPSSGARRRRATAAPTRSCCGRSDAISASMSADRPK
jgi:hypothetical protein